MDDGDAPGTGGDAGDGDLNVVDRPDARRYELRRGDEVISFATYRLADGVVTIPHVETHWEYRGRGFADTLMAGIVDDARDRDLRIRAVCPFAAAFVRGYEPAHALLAD